MPAGAFVLRRRDATQRPTSLAPRRASATDADDDRPNSERGSGGRRFSVTDSANSDCAAAPSSSSLCDLNANKSSPNKKAREASKDRSKRGGRLGRISHLKPSFKPSPLFSSSNVVTGGQATGHSYVHLETSPSVDSSSETAADRNRTTTVEKTAASSGAAGAADAAASRIASARRRMKLLRHTTPITTANTSSNEDDIELSSPASHHHPHTPPFRGPNTVPSPSAEGRPNGAGGGRCSISSQGTVTAAPPGSNAKAPGSNAKVAAGDAESGVGKTAAARSLRPGRKMMCDSSHQSTIDQASSGPGVFLNDGQRRVDFILVYQSGNSASLERQRRYFEKNLQQEGLVLELDPLDGNEEIGKLCFVKVHAPWNTLCRSAEMLQMKMPLKNARLPEESTSLACGDARGAGGGGPWGLIFDALCASWFKFNDTEKLLIGHESNYVTAQFTRARIEQFLINDTDTFFSPTQRIRIVYDIMQRAKCDPDDAKKRGIQWLLKSAVYTAAYPPHDGGTETRHLNTTEREFWSERQILRHTWANFNRLFKPQPLNLIRTYFGEKVGFYFAWLGFYTQMLIFPSIVGVICFLYGVFSLPSNPVIIELCAKERRDREPANLTMCPVCVLPYCHPWTLHDACEGASWNYRFDHESHVVMAVFTLTWATLFMELWKRKEAELACEWDAYDAEQEEEGTRPEFEARTQLVRISPVTNEEEPFVPAAKRILWSLQSLSGLFMLILCVVAALVALITVRILLYGVLGSLGGTWKQYQFEFASLIIHVLTFVIVMTLGWVYERAAHRLTELECPRTQADYLSSYIWKVFIFEILNNFAPVLYAALIRGRSGLPQDQTLLLEMCDPGGCLNEVVQAIAILLLARLLISNAAELGVPFLKSVLKTMRLGAAVNPEHADEPTLLRNLPRWQKDYTLNETKMDGVYAEYLEMMVQFGYVTLFVSAFPLAPLICLLNNLAEIRIDATNFVTSFRRPLPSRVSGIRIWRRCLNILIKLSVLCNGAFLAFTSELIPKLVYRLWYSPDGSTHGYFKWTLAKVDTTTWPEYARYAPVNGTECYYRDFRLSADGDYGPSLVWWQVMVAKLAFFIVFVIAFYFIQWLCDFLVPDVPQHVKLRVDRASFLAKQALYGHEMKGTASSSATPRPGSRPRHSVAHTGPWLTAASCLVDHVPRPVSSLATTPLANGEAVTEVHPAAGLANGEVLNVNGHVPGAEGRNVRRPARPRSQTSSIVRPDASTDASVDIENDIIAQTTYV